MEGAAGWAPSVTFFAALPAMNAALKNMTYRGAPNYAGSDTLAGARAEILPDPLAYLVPLTPAAQRESYER